jgi:hypothetical protein
MLGLFNLPKIPFEFKTKTFHTFDKDCITLLLGKNGNQTAINTAGSLWKKTIVRNVTQKQAESIKINPKWVELFNFLQSHLTTKNAILIPDSKIYVGNSLEQISESTKFEDKKIFSEFLRFRELQIHNIIKFKEVPSFRKNILKILLDKKNNFKRNILPQYSYILLTLYIAKKYSIFNNYKFKDLELKLNISNEEYLKKFFNGLKSDNKLTNVTALCYTQFFWFDYRLSDSVHSEIHTILYDLFNELKLPS